MAQCIQNFEALATTSERRDALSIAEAGYATINVGAALRRTLRREGADLHIGEKTRPLAAGNIFFVGVGKCAFAAATAIEDILGDALVGGIALDVSPIEGRAPAKIATYIGTHPLPSDVNEQATKHIMEFLAGRAATDLVIMLISGGGSTLLSSPDAPMTYEDESALWSDLTSRGATIQDINTVRKHTSRARGGGLAFAAYPAEVVALIVSDVPGNDIAYIASGPTVHDASTVADAREVLSRFGVTPSASVVFMETPKEERYFERVTNMLFLTSLDALRAMEEEAAKRGYAVQITDEHFSGEARDIGRAVVEQLHGAAAKTAFLSAGESTVTITGAHGAGGRNQEMALAALAHIRDGELILPFASDGRDNTDHAGAVGDAVTREHARAHGLSADEYLAGHRAYDFFSTLDDALITGYTGSNVSDLIIALKQ